MEFIIDIYIFSIKVMFYITISMGVLCAFVALIDLIQGGGKE